MTLGRRELADILRIHPASLSSMVSNGRGPKPYIQGTRNGTWFRDADITAWATKLDELDRYRLLWERHLKTIEGLRK